MGRPSAVSCVLFVSFIALHCRCANAARHHGAYGPADFEKEGASSTRGHEPDFAMIENIYKKGQLRSSSVRKHMKVDVLPAESSSLGVNRLLWDLFYPDYNCPYGKSRHGRVGDGGKWICGARTLLSKPGCVIYSLGSNAETSFETDMALETECEIHVFDPTQTSVPMPSTHRSGSNKFHESLFKEAKSIPVGQLRFDCIYAFCSEKEKRREGEIVFLRVHVLLLAYN